MKSRRISGDLFERLLNDDESVVSLIVTGVLFKILPDAEWNNIQAFLGVLTVYMAVFSVIHYSLEKYFQYREKKNFTERTGREDAC